MSNQKDSLSLVIYRPPLPPELLNVLFRVLHYLGVILVVYTCVILFFQGNQYSKFFSLLCPLGLALRSTGLFFTRNINAYLKGDVLDPKEESSYIYSLYLKWSDHLFLGGVILGLSLITTLGKVTMNADGANTQIDWLVLITAVLLLVTSHELKSFSEKMLREKIVPPILALTWPSGADIPVPLPTNPEKEPVPYRF